MLEYMKELSKIELLAHEEEISLWSAFKEEGNMEARTILIEHYQPLVFKEAYTYRNLTNDMMMDCIQEGIIGLIEAVERYDHHKGVAFSLFATHRIRGSMLDFLRKEGKSDVVFGDDASSESWWEQLPSLSSSTEEVVEGKLYGQLVTTAMGKLPEREKFVMEQVYLEDSSVAQVASDLSCSNSYIHRLRRQGLGRLKKMLSSAKKTWQDL